MTKRQLFQVLGLSSFAAACMAMGIGLSQLWVGHAQGEAPVTVDAKGLDRLPPTVEVAEKLSPTVVSITNTSFVKRNRNRGGDPFGDGFFDWFFGPGGPRQGGGRNTVPEEERVQAGGSGVVISPDGEILTNAHVVDGVRGGEVEIEVRTSENRTFKATILGKDKELDIALLKIEASHLPYAKLGDSDAMRIGEWVVAIGNPLGLDHTVTQGIISGKGRKIVNGLDSFLQTDAAINRGNSGGPLLNMRGEIIGINTAINPAGQNIGFAVPINMVKRVLADLRSGKPVSRGFLGVTPAELDKGFQESLGVKEGVVVGDVQKGQAADKAGVQRLDVITAVDGQPVKSASELVFLVSACRAGQTVKLTIWRDGKSREIPVVLGDRREMSRAAGQGDEPEEEEDAAQEGDKSVKSFSLEKSYGFTVEGLSAANRHQFQVPENVKGVVVTGVSARSKAADVPGFQPGALILAVGRQEVATLQEFTAAVKKAGGKPLLLLVRPIPGRNEQITVAVQPR